MLTIQLAGVVDGVNAVISRDALYQCDNLYLKLTKFAMLEVN